jgi:hypothetical protein
VRSRIARSSKGTDIAPLLENAKGRTVVETKAGDLDAAFDNALKKAQATQAAQATSGTCRTLGRDARGGPGAGPSPAGPSRPHAPPCRAANTGPAMAGRVPGRGRRHGTASSP